MTSLNGDTYVIRNGRSMSEVSVYNYPEHLNPFYEDEQHKRLRFWRINKSKDNEGRRNSFSTAFKDIWAFKSFRMKKKSSTLGINKTSESPPPLRRDFQYSSIDNNGLHTYDPRQRYTTNGTHATMGNNFERNTIYRSSLQNMNSGYGENIGFKRNDQYRSTIQVGGNTSLSPSSYSYGAKSLTPQSLRNNKFHRGNSSETLTSGVSQTSFNSTNPFENDDDDQTETSDMQKKESLTKLSQTKPTRERKKRRAPPPPVPIHVASTNPKFINSNSDSNRTQNIELHITENNSEDNPENKENLDISNLTAEIEDFVKNSNDISEPDKTGNTNTFKDIVIQKSKQNQVESENYSKTKEIKIKCNYNNPESVEVANEAEKVNVPMITINMNDNTAQKEVPTSSSTIKSTGEVPQKTQEIGKIECIHVHLDRTDNVPETKADKTTTFKSQQKPILKPILKPKPNISAVHINRDEPKAIIESRTDTQIPSTIIKVKIDTDFNEKISPKTHNQPKTKSNEPGIKDSNGTVSTQHIQDSRKSNQVIMDSNEAISTKNIQDSRKCTTNITNSLDTPKKSVSVSIANPLKIVESEEVLVKRNEISPTNSTYNAASEDTTTSIPSAISTTPQVTSATSNMSNLQSQLIWRQSTLAPLEPHIPPEKRRSVKDIIESINRSQRLLNAAAHREPQTSSLTILSDHMIERDNYIDIINYNNDLSSVDELRTLPSSQNNVNRNQPLYTEPCSAPPSYEESQKLDNSEIFRKFQIKKQTYDYRESSPTTSNLDWNPLPKPKRTKNIQDE